MAPYRGTSLIRNSAPLAPYRRTTHRNLLWSKGGGAVQTVSHSIQGYLAHKKHAPPLVPYSRAVPRALLWSLGGGAGFL